MSTIQEKLIAKQNKKWLERDGSKNPKAHDPCAASQESIRFSPKARDHSNFEQPNERSKIRGIDYLNDRA